MNLDTGSVLPLVSPNRLAGLMETVAAEPYGGKADLPIIASTLQKEVDDLFPIAETLQMLRFADVGDGDIRLTEGGKDFAAAEMDERKQLFRRQLLCYVPLAQHVRRVLDERASHTAPKSRFLDELEDYMTAEAAEQTLRAVIDWGRYAEAFAYDDEMATFSLENPT
jgi:NitT/TauT family transport system ATP-binding protein